MLSYDESAFTLIYFSLDNHMPIVVTEPLATIHYCSTQEIIVEIDLNVIYA